MTTQNWSGVLLYVKIGIRVTNDIGQGEETSRWQKNDSSDPTTEADHRVNIDTIDNIAAATLHVYKCDEK